MPFCRRFSPRRRHERGRKGQPPSTARLHPQVQREDGPVKVVEELILQCDRPMRIFDPFCGTATTALSAACHGHEGTTTDINPFLVWLGQAKTARYSPGDLAATRDACARSMALVARKQVVPVPLPPIHNIGRWWAPGALGFLCSLRAAIDAVSERLSPERDLLLVAFCRTLISLSNDAFNHQSM